MKPRQFIISTCAAVGLGLIGGGASAQTAASGPCVNDRVLAFSIDADRAFADYTNCALLNEVSLRLTCRNGSSFAGIIVMLGDHVAANQHVSLTFHTDGTGHLINGVTYWDDYYDIAGFDANLDFDGMLIPALRRAETFSVETSEIHLVGAAPTINDMLTYCGRA